MSDIIQRVINIIHQDINPYSPANPHMFQLYREQPQDYRLRLQQQAQRYAAQSPALFAHPSVHINVLTD
jgi:ubiquitin-protein ligase